MTFKHNIAAFLREDDAHTVGVVFESTAKVYTYVVLKTMDLSVTDMVVVPAGDKYMVGRVIRVDQTVNLKPTDTIEYKWVVCKVDFTAYEALTAENKRLASTVTKLLS